MARTTYSEKLRNPLWQKKRLEIMSRDEFTCQGCYDTESTLAVHHRFYLPGCEPWEYPDDLLVTLCEHCHEQERANMVDMEVELTRAVKMNFLSIHIPDIIIALKYIKMVHAPEVVASAVEYALTSESVMKEIVDRYFNHLKEQERE